MLSAARMSSGARFIAVASRDAARAQAYAREHDLERAYGSYDELLNDPDIEAVYISLPNHLHVEWTARALEAGKHVLCEKPLARDPVSAARLVATAREAGLLLSEAFMYRHHPITLRVAELVRDGAIGRLRLIRSSFSFPLADAEGDVRSSVEFDGGALLDLGCYCVSLARLLAGEPEWAFGWRRSDWGDVDRDFVGLLHFSDDVIAVFDVSMAMPIRGEVEVVGTAGRLEVEDPWHCRVPRVRVHHEYSIEEIVCEQVDPYRLEFDNFSRSIRGEEVPLIDSEDAVRQAAAVAAVLESSESNVPAPVDSAVVAGLGDPTARR